MGVVSGEWLNISGRLVVDCDKLLLGEVLSEESCSRMSCSNYKCHNSNDCELVKND